MKSDTDCEGASESEAQKEHVVKTKHVPKPEVTVEEQCSDQDELIGKCQNIALTDGGTVKAIISHFDKVIVTLFLLLFVMFSQYI